MVSDTSSPTRPDGRSTRYREHRVARRAALVASALDAVRQLGPGAGLDAIAAHTGVAKPVFYRYFDHKADLFRAVATSAADAVVVAVTAALDAEDEPRASLAAAIDTYLVLIEREPALYRFVVGEPRATTAGGDPLTDFVATVARHASRRVAGLLPPGSDPARAWVWGFALVGAVRAAADHWLDEPTLPRETLVSQLTDLAWGGLAAAVVPPVG